MSNPLPVAWTPAPAPKVVEPSPISTLADQVANDFIWSYSNKSTRENYIRGLKVWFTFCVGIGIDPLTGIEGQGVRRSDLEKFLRYTEDVQGNARRTVAGYYCAIKGFFRRARMDGHIDKDPCEFVKAPVVERKTTTNDLTRRQYGRILDLAEKRSPRDFAIFSILGQNGFRNAELVGLDIEDLGSDRGWTTATIHRKGGKTETQTFSMQTAYAVQQHLAAMGNLGITSGALFRSKRNPANRITSSDLQALVKSYAKKANVAQRISPHSFRHFFVTQCRDAGIADREIMAATGHADMRMIPYYDHGNATKGREATHGLSTFIAEMRGDD